MAEEYNPPSIDPADEDSLAGVLRGVLAKTLQNVDDMLPATVIAYDRETNRATVQPQIMMGTTDGQKVSRAQIASVPVFQFGAGGFVMAFPVKPGDLGWIKASDRDISLFLQEHKEEWPNTKRMHSFQDGLFIPDVMRQWTLDAEDQERLVIQTTDGATRIAVGVGEVVVTAPTKVRLDTPLVEVTGRVEAEGGVTGAGIVLESHVHGGVQTGSDQTGGPV